MRKENYSDKRKKILLAAAKIITKKGYHNTQMDDIAREANVAKGTLYLYFSSKQELFTVFIDNIFQQASAVLDDIKDHEVNCVEKIRLFIESQLKFFSEHKQLFAIMIRETYAVDKTLDAKYKQKIFTRHKKVVESLSKIIQQGIKEGLIKPINPQFCALILTSIMSSVIFGNVERRNKQELTKQVPAVLDIFLNGIGKQQKHDVKK